MNSSVSTLYTLLNGRFAWVIGVKIYHLLRAVGVWDSTFDTPPACMCMCAHVCCIVSVFVLFQQMFTLSVSLNINDIKHMRIWWSGQSLECKFNLHQESIIIIITMFISWWKLFGGVINTQHYLLGMPLGRVVGTCSIANRLLVVSNFN